MESLLHKLGVFHGDLTAARALVYARLPRPAEDAAWSLSGTVRGPRCLHAQTLPLAVPLVDAGPGPTLLAKAIVPDPVFWSPDLPAIYDVTINLQRGAEIVASDRREIGLRSLGVEGRSLILGGQKWVLRGISTDSTNAVRPRFWHDESVALVLASGVREHPDGAAPLTDKEPYREADASRSPLAEASQWGALSIFPVSAGDAQTQLRELSRFPGAAIAVFRDKLPPDIRPGQVAPNILIAQMITAGDLSRIDPRIDLLLADSRWLTTSSIAIAAAKPVIASRRLQRPVDLAQARAECDKLQRDLAPFGQFAGYIV
jgi:hypothetical protein